MLAMNRSRFLALCYADVFNYPLTAAEMQKWRINIKLPIFSKNKKAANWYKSQNYYYLEGKKNLIDLRKKRFSYSTKKLLIAQKVASYFRFIPFIKLAAVTGALSMDNSGKNDDIDFLIITAHNRVWITRLAIIVFLELLKLRRKPKDTKVNNKICPNLFLDETKMRLKKKERNIYTAHEVCQIKPLLNKDRTYEKFLSVNSWTRRYLPGAIERKNIHPAVIRQRRLNILDLIDKLAYRFQYHYMRPRITRETVEYLRVFFHPRDTRKRVEEKFFRRINNYF